MEIKQYATILVSLVVGVVIFSALMPAFASSTAAEDTFYNEGYYYLSEVSEQDYTLTWNYSNPQVVVINGVDHDLSTLSTVRDYTIFGSSSMLVRYMYRSDGSGYGINAFPEEVGSVSATEGAAVNFTLTYTASTKTVVLTGNRSATQVLNGEVYAIDPSGDYVMKFADEPVHVLGSSPIVGIGRTSLAGATISTWLSAMGGIDNGLDVVFFNSTPAGTTAGDVTITKTDISGFVDLYTVTNFKFPITQGDNTATAVYSYFIVPASITAERSAHLDGASLAIVNIMPIVIIAGLVVAAVAFITRKG